MFSGEGEDVPFCETLYPVGNVEDWLLNVERVMKASLKQIIGQALQNYQKVREGDSQLGCAGLCVLHHRLLPLI